MQCNKGGERAGQETRGVRKSQHEFWVLNIPTRRHAGTSHAVAAVGAHSIVRVDAPRDNAHVQVVLGTAVGVGARAQAGQGHLVHLGASRGLLHREQATRLLPLAAKLLETNENFLSIDWNIAHLYLFENRWKNMRGFRAQQKDKSASAD